MATRTPSSSALRIPSIRAARFLQYYVRDRGVLSFEDGIRKLTSVPAERLGLKDRGKLRPGGCADVCAFDPSRIASNCTPRHPRRYASGIVHVIVNGNVSMRDGERTSDCAGRVLRDRANRAELP